MGFFDTSLGSWQPLDKITNVSYFVRLSHQMLIPKSSVPIPTARYMACL